MNKALKVILNVLIVIAALVFILCFFDMLSSIKYANREKEDPAERYAGIFEYMLENRAYGEVLDDYYSQRLNHFDPEPGYEDLYRVAEYGHAAFMIRVCDEKGDVKKSSGFKEKTESLKKELGSYEYTADVMDEMISRAP